MYSHLIEKVSCIPSSCYVEKEPDLRPSEIISRIMRDDISFSYASRIRDAYFPNESFEELFVEDNPDDCHLTAAESKERIEALEREVKRLKAQLEQEMEWTVYEDRDDISQVDYDELRTSGRPMTDEEAIDWVEQETGFARHRISIVHEAPALEINRHNMIRRTGKTFDRSPIYDATDYHYIRFNVRANVTMSYILYNDNLIPRSF